MFSVVIPVHNKLPHLDRSVHSVLKQTFGEFELLLIDDASTDGSSEKIKEYADPRIRTFKRNTPGPGGYAARNLGIKEAKYDWIAFLDADDEWEAAHLQNIRSLTMKYPDVEFSACGWRVEGGKIEGENNFFKKNKHGSYKIDLETYLKNCLKYQNPVWTSVVCVKKSSLPSLELFPENENAKRGGDMFAWLKLMCARKNLYWSNHLGAVYHTGAVNKVTKKIKGEFVLYQKEKYEQLAKELNLEEKKLLKKYFNFFILRNWLNSNKVTTPSLEKLGFISISDIRFKLFAHFSFLPTKILKSGLKYIYA